MSLGVPPAQFPAKGSPQVAAATRNKVALKPGRSLLDWIRFSKNAKDLPGTGGRIIKVTTEELAKHNTRDDCWMAIRGVVYNVSAYMDYHPGGEDELLRGAGIDATNLFDEVHRWVNVESMLANCVVGPYMSDPTLLKAQQAKSKPRTGLTGSQSSLSSSGSANLLPPLPSSGSSVDGPPPSFMVPSRPSKKVSSPRYEWYQSDDTMTIVVYTRYKDIQAEHVVIDKTGKDFKLAIRLQSHFYHLHLELEEEIENDYSVKVSRPSGKCEISLGKVKTGYKWTRIGSALEGHESTVKISEADACYRSCNLLDVTEINHDCKLYCFALPEATRMCIPLGYHVYLRANVEGMEFARAYTVVPPSLRKDDWDTRLDRGCVFYLLVKIYTDGALTPLLGKMSIGDTFDVSNYEGNFDESQQVKCTDLIMLAAGTGITPMLGLLRHAVYNIHNDNRSMKLMFFNKEERDIILQEQLDELSAAYPKLEITYVLSRPSSTWTGATGRIRRELLEGFLPTVTEGKSLLFCACGPTAFTEAAVSLAKEFDYTDEMIHAFLG